MKASLLTIFLTVCCLCTRAQVKNDLARQKLIGKIKSVTENEYDAKGIELKSKNVSKYDDNGNQLDFYSYSPDNEVLSKSLFNYNDSGKLIDVKRYKGDGSLNVRATFKYDAQGNVAEEDNYDPGGMLFMKATFRYTGKGNQINCDRFNEYGILFLKTNSKFDPDSHVIEEKEYDSHHGLKFTTTYEYETYDNAGNWTRRTTYKNDDPWSVTERTIEYR